MSNYFLYGDASNPTLIYGRYDRGRLNPEFTELFNSAEESDFLNYQVNRHEFWFSTDINFIPHGGSPVFITDVQGNITHEGNLLTKKNITVNGPSTFIGPSEFKNQVTIEQTLLVKQDIRITRDLYVQGRIFSPQLDALGSVDDIKTEIELLKDRIKVLEDATAATPSEDMAASPEE